MYIHKPNNTLNHASKCFLTRNSLGHMGETGGILDPGTCSEIIRQFPQNGNKQTKKNG